jgi:hypothetical protein
MGLARAGLLRDALGSLAVVGVVAVIAFGLPFLDRHLPDTRPMSAGVPYQVGGGVTVEPPAGALLDVTKTRPESNRGTVLFTVGGVRVAVVVTPYRGDLDGATNRLRNKIMRVGAGQIINGDAPISARGGVVGRQGTYTGQDRVGTYTVFIAGGRSAEVTASGSNDDLTRLASDFDAMVRTLTFRSGP